MFFVYDTHTVVDAEQNLVFFRIGFSFNMPITHRFRFQFCEIACIRY